VLAENLVLRNPLLHQAPKGLLGRIYWCSTLPFNYFIFDGMAENVMTYKIGFN